MSALMQIKESLKKLPATFIALVFCYLLKGASCRSENLNDSAIIEETIKEDFNNSGRFYIGGVLPDFEAESYFRTVIKNLNFDGESVCPSCTLYHVTFLASDNPLKDAELVCSNLISNGSFAIVLGGGNISSSVTAAVSYTGGFYHIPIIGTAARESAFSDKNIHVSFLRTVPPFSHQVDVWVKLLRAFKYSQIVFIHSSDSDGRTLLGRLQAYAEDMQDDRTFKISSVVEFDSGCRDFHSKLLPLKESLVRVFIIFASQEDAGEILRVASELDITGNGSVWLLTEDALSSENVPIGAFGLKLKYLQDQEAHISDSLRIVSLALRKLQDENPELITSPPNTCEQEEPWDITGNILYKTIKEQILYDGKSGKVAFDLNGDRKYAEYNVVNVQYRQLNSSLRPEENSSLKGQPVIHKTVGEYHYNKIKDSMDLVINFSDIVWGGGSSKRPSGISVPRNVKVITIEETPFLFAENVSVDTPCTDSDESFCTWKDPVTSVEHQRCCYGYCVELLKALAHKNDFSFNLYLSSDGLFGENILTKEGQVWTGMIGELTNQTGGADMIVAPLTINQERAKVIDFSKPFKYQGITILMKKAPHSNALVSILQPFQLNLWLMLLATVHGIALLVWLLDRLSPMYKKDGTETDSLKISEAFWFSWGVILNSGLGEGTPRCLSSRVMSMIWAGFAMILVASYTANLAAFLVLEDHGEVISGINDPKLRNPVDGFLFATVRGSSVDMFFRRKTEWANMYRVMETNNFNSAEEAMKAVKNGSLQAFIWDSSRLEYEAARDCELITVGELFGRSGYGIGLRKGLFWSEKITLDILEFHESGFMADLDEEWIWDGGPVCPPDRSNSPQRLGLENLEGIFMMVVGGVVAGIILIILELAYDRYDKRRNNKQGKTMDGNFAVTVPSSFVETPIPGGEGSRSPTDSSLCELCSDNFSESGASTCPFCSQISSGACDGSHLYDDVKQRLKLSSNVPNSLRDLTPLESLQLKLKMRQDSAEAPFELSSKSLQLMINSLDERGVGAVPCCSSSNVLGAKRATAADGTTTRQQNDDEGGSSSDSIISGQFSYRRKPGNPDRSYSISEALPDVVFIKKHEGEPESESESEYLVGGNLYFS